MEYQLNYCALLRQCPYFYEPLPILKPTKPHMALFGDKEIVAEDNSDYVFTRSECHRETFSRLSQEFSDSPYS